MNKEILKCFKLCICGGRRVFELEATFYSINKVHMSSKTKMFKFCGNNKCLSELVKDFEEGDIIYSPYGYKFQYAKN